MVGLLVMLGVFASSVPLGGGLDGGSLVLNEVMIDPIASSSIEVGQWIEVYNNSSEWVNLSNWSIENGAGESVQFSSYMLQPGGFFIIGASSIVDDNGGYAPDDIWYDFSLNLDGSLILSSIGTDFSETIDWDSSWDLIPGCTLERVNPGWSCSDIESWNHSSAQFGNGDSGTPGTQNSVFSNGFGQNTWAFIKAFVR